MPFIIFTGHAGSEVIGILVIFLRGVEFFMLEKNLYYMRTSPIFPKSTVEIGFSLSPRADPPKLQLP